MVFVLWVSLCGLCWLFQPLFLACGNELWLLAVLARPSVQQAGRLSRFLILVSWKFHFAVCSWDGQLDLLSWSKVDMMCLFKHHTPALHHYKSVCLSTSLSLFLLVYSYPSVCHLCFLVSALTAMYLLFRRLLQLDSNMRWHWEGKMRVTSNNYQLL